MTSPSKQDIKQMITRYDPGRLLRSALLCFSFICTMGMLSGQWVQVGQDINGTNEEDWLGFALSITPDGNRFIVSAPGNYPSQTKPGYALVYEYDNSNWVQVGDAIWGEEWDEHSGISVSISHIGNRVAVGAGFNDDGGALSSGQVRVFDYDLANSTWVQVGQDLNGSATNDYFGNTISLDATGMRLAVGADGNDNSSGLARIFDYNSITNQWEQVGQDLEGENTGDWFGAIVLLSHDGSRLVVTAPYYDGANGPNSGHVQAYDYNPISNLWEQVGQNIEGEAEGDYSSNFGSRGLSISSDGSRIAIGAKHNDGNGVSSGHVRVYDFDSVNLNWIQVGQDIDGEASFDQSGATIALSTDGRRLAVGAPYNDGNEINSGHIRIYEFNNITHVWEQVGGDIDGETSDDDFGGTSETIALTSNGTRLLVGARLNDDGALDGGQLKVYDYLGCTSDVLLNYNNFEEGFGIWNDGGNDCDRVEGNASSGSYSIRLRDNSGINSSIYTDDLNLEGVSFVTIRFSYYAISMESGKDFFLEVSTDGGNTWDIYKTWVSGENFRNETRVNESVSVSLPFSATTRFRIRCDGQTNNDRIYIDDISIWVCTVDGCPVEGEPCSDGDPCTIGEIFTADCNCAGGVYTDSDLDGYCVGEDPDDHDPCIPDPSSLNCDNAADSMHIDNITMGRRFAGPNWNAVARVLVLDEFGIPVPTASVSGSWSGLVLSSSSDLTDGEGIAVFNSPKSRADGCFTFTVDTIVKTGWTYDASANVMDNNTICQPIGAAMAISGRDNLSDEGLTVYPNPFNERVSVMFHLDMTDEIVLDIYDIRGRNIARLYQGELMEGDHQFSWAASTVGEKGQPEGVYLVRMATSTRIWTKRIILVR